MKRKNTTCQTARSTVNTSPWVLHKQGVCVKRVAADDASASVSLTDMAAGIYIVRANGTGATYRLIKH